MLIVLTALGVPVTAVVCPRTTHNFSESPLAYVIPLAVAVSLAAMQTFERQAREKAAFVSSCAYIVAMLAGVAVALYPSLLPSSGRFQQIQVGLWVPLLTNSLGLAASYILGGDGVS